MNSYSVGQTLRVIPHQNEADESFKEKARARIILNSIGDAVLSTDITGNVTYLNVVAEKMTGWDRKGAVGRPLAEVFQIIDGTTRTTFQNPMKLAIERARAVNITTNRILVRRDGHESFIEDRASPLHDRNGQITGGLIVFHDVSAARAMSLQMSYLAQYDALTDLPNRIVFIDRLDQAIASAQRNSGNLAVLFLGLDGFKQVNDSLGHAIGDELLQSVAMRLKRCVRNSDTVSRQDGEEFVILLSEITHSAEAVISAQKILTMLRPPHIIAGHELQAVASIGLSTYPEDGDDADTLINNASAAMYYAKRQGRDTCQIFEGNMKVSAVKSQTLEASLRRALDLCCVIGEN